MFDAEVNRIRDILTEVLGNPKNEPYANGWQSYNCPYCAVNSGVDNDGKYNLETNVEHGGIFHCWKCEARGKLSKLIKDFGNSYQLSEYREILNTIRSSALYQLDRRTEGVETIEVEQSVALPSACFRIDVERKNLPLEYLRSRGITDDIIQRFNISFTEYFADEFIERNRIIIPSYDVNGELNYWVGRDYTGKNKVKYCNAKVPKTNIIFNEGLINWYENITLVEGPFDHIVVPNSIPLLGKVLSRKSAIYKTLVEKAKAMINVFLDGDALDTAYKTYKFLNNNGFRDRVRLIRCPEEYDASLIFQKFGKRGMIRMLQRAEKVDEYTLLRY